MRFAIKSAFYSHAVTHEGDTEQPPNDPDDARLFLTSPTLHNFLVINLNYQYSNVLRIAKYEGHLLLGSRLRNSASF